MQAPGPGPAPDPISRLEARVRWLTGLSSFLTLGFLALLAWELLPRPRIVEGNAFVLRDSQWRRRAVLGFRENETPMLRFNNEAGHDKLMLFVRENGEAVLRFTDASDVHRARLGLEASGQPVLRLNGADGRTRVSLAPLGAGYSGIQVLNDAQKPVWTAP